MGMMKRFAERVSEALGFDGNLTRVACRAGQEILDGQEEGTITVDTGTPEGLRAALSQLGYSPVDVVRIPAGGWFLPTGQKG